MLRTDAEVRGADIAGTVFGNVSAASASYGQNRFNTRRGHSFAAERANHLYDKLRGHNVEILGDDNRLNGAGCSVDGVAIQSKYCATGGKCISECFKDGKFRYPGMQIEVPSDKYESAVHA